MNKKRDGMTMSRRVSSKDDCKLLLNFSVRTDHGARRPGFVIIDKRDKSCQIIDVAIPENGEKKTEKKETERNRNEEKEDEKV